MFAPWLWARRRAMARAWQANLASIGQIYFQASPVFGAILLLCLYISGPVLAAGCLLGACVATFTAWALEFPAAERQSGLYSFNAALSGVGLCVFYQFNAALVATIVLAGILTAIGTQALRSRKMAPLTLQFVLVMWLAGAAGPYLGLRAAAAPPTAGCGMAPLGFVFCALAQVSFATAAPLGMLLWTALARGRWHLGVWALAGGAFAWCLAAADAQLGRGVMLSQQAAGMAVNCVLVSMGLHLAGRPWQLHILGWAAVSLFCAGFAAMGWPAFTMPFVLTMWLVQGALFFAIKQ